MFGADYRVYFAYRLLYPLAWFRVGQTCTRDIFADENTCAGKTFSTGIKLINTSKLMHGFVDKTLC